MLSSFRVFETQTWSYEQWNLDSPVQSAVWSSHGRALLFATRDEPVLFSIGFIDGEGVGGAKVAAQMADLSLQEITTESSESIM